MNRLNLPVHVRSRPAFGASSQPAAAQQYTALGLQPAGGDAQRAYGELPQYQGVTKE